MIIESVLIVTLAFVLDFMVGDPKTKYHPTAWIGSFIAKLSPIAKNGSPTVEKVRGTLLVLFVTCFVVFLILILDFLLNLIKVDFITLIVSIVTGAVLLKTTIAIKGMKKHALSVVNYIEKNDLVLARENLAKIVKRNTKNLDKNHVLSGVLESISENTVDGITGPLFFFAIFGLPGAFVYRTINTIDSMIGYKTSMFMNVGWFGANCDKILNYLPSRLTGFIMILGSMILGYHWRSSYQIMIRDSKKTESPNAGYPMAALAGALGTRLVKIDHYTLGQGRQEISRTHINSAILLMQVTSILFFVIVTIPIIFVLANFGWWIYA